MADRCIACGMPMSSPEDFALGDISKEYCRHCMRPDGSMQSYEEKLAAMSGFLIKTQGLDPGAATETVRRMLADLPAWKAVP